MLSITTDMMEDDCIDGLLDVVLENRPPWDTKGAYTPDKVMVLCLDVMFDNRLCIDLM